MDNHCPAFTYVINYKPGLVRLQCSLKYGHIGPHTDNESGGVFEGNMSTYADLDPTQAADQDRPGDVPARSKVMNESSLAEVFNRLDIELDRMNAISLSMLEQLKIIASNTAPRTMVIESLDQKQLAEFSAEWQKAAERAGPIGGQPVVTEIREVEPCGYRVPYQRSNVFCSLPKGHDGECQP